MAPPQRVGSRELKTRLGRYLQMVRQGNTLVITDRGEPVAEMRPLPSAHAADEDDPFAELIAKGIVTRVERRPLGQFKPIRMRGRSLSSAIREDRDEGY